MNDQPEKSDSGMEPFLKPGEDWRDREDRAAADARVETSAELPDDLLEKLIKHAGLATPDRLMARREAHLSGTLLAAIATPELAIALATAEGSKRRGYQHADHTAAVIRDELDRRNGPPSDRSEIDELYEARIQEVYEAVPTDGRIMASFIAHKLDGSTSEITAKLKLLKRRGLVVYDNGGCWSRS